MNLVQNKQLVDVVVLKPFRYLELCIHQLSVKNHHTDGQPLFLMVNLSSSNLVKDNITNTQHTNTLCAAKFNYGHSHFVLQLQKKMFTKNIKISINSNACVTLVLIGVKIHYTYTNGSRSHFSVVSNQTK